MAVAFPDLRAEVAIPRDGTTSRKLYEDEHFRLVVFGFDGGQELTEHTSSAEVVVQVVSGRVTVTVDGVAHALGPASWLVLAPRQAHSLLADEPSVVLLTLIGASRG